MLVLINPISQGSEHWHGDDDVYLLSLTIAKWARYVLTCNFAHNIMYFTQYKQTFFFSCTYCSVFSCILLHKQTVRRVASFNITPLLIVQTSVNNSATRLYINVEGSRWFVVYCDLPGKLMFVSVNLGKKYISAPNSRPISIQLHAMIPFQHSENDHLIYQCHHIYHISLIIIVLSKSYYSHYHITLTIILLSLSYCSR